MPKGDYRSNKPRMARRPTDNDRLRAALADCLTELKYFAEDSVCDHSVGICYCGYHRAVDQATKLLAAHERSERFINELDEVTRHFVERGTTAPRDRS
jgi:hypothetical protein